MKCHSTQERIVLTKLHLLSSRFLVFLSRVAAHGLAFFFGFRALKGNHDAVRFLSHGAYLLGIV